MQSRTLSFIHSRCKSRAVQTRAAGIQPMQSQVLCQNTLWIRNLPFNERRSALELQLAAHLPDARRLWVKPAKKSSVGRPDHAGWALAQFAAEPPMEPLAGKLGALMLSLAPRALCPAEWLEADGPSEADKQQQQQQQRQREHQRNQRRRKQQLHVQTIRGILQDLPYHEEPQTLTLHDFLTSQGTSSVPLRWADIPATCRVSFQGYSHEPRQDVSAFQIQRAKRKEAQCESFSLILQLMGIPEVSDYLEQPPCIVEFGCGSGNLLLPLAAAMPACHFHGVDVKARPVQRLLERARAAGLENVTASVELIQDYSGPLDVALALHACGPATDYAMLQAQQARAAFVVCPCCIGKLNAPQIAASLQQPLLLPSVISRKQDGSSSSSGAIDEDGALDQGWRQHVQSRLQHPRSRWMRDSLPRSDPRAAYAVLARAADISDIASSASAEGAQLCLRAKAVVLKDRAEAAREDRYLTATTQLLRPELHMFKAEVLVGLPKERLRTGREDVNKSRPLFSLGGLAFS